MSRKKISHPLVKIEPLVDHKAVFVDIKADDGLIPAEAAKSIALLLTDAAIEAMGRPKDVAVARAAFISSILSMFYASIDRIIATPLCRHERRVFLDDLARHVASLQERDKLMEKDE